ncbi:MAG: ABC transporter ATP-binding protein [Rothia sp. (in: high G+C Gram-positive bacteria)]|uniref:ABC transporter ATP-binding protein n=1 Tax=Rothia sp. (in: high G+C Gram-positive bacteria) TaxID=1885016 RepID=UPI002700612E|nr:ABC transporter ATP-binding protein [Rothia sp. (in: high G+C Gram-positive bacteria)]
MSTTPVLSVRDLNVKFNTENGIVHAVRGIDFDLYAGKTLGIVGESGSGKSVASMAIMGLHPTTADITGSIKYNGTELLGLSDKQMCDYRGKEISMVFQDPLSSLTPVFTIGHQLAEVLKAHNKGMSDKAIQARSVELLRLVGIPSPESRLKSFPHEFSGGMRQRVMIAMAIANEPRVLIADEPTTALDVTIQAQVLEVMQKAQEETGAATIMITHDLGIVAGMADEIMVMYAGKAVEHAAAADLYKKPSMPYTIGLLGAVPRVDRKEKASLVPIEGTPPNLLKPVVGCSFAPRCPVATDACLTQEPELKLIAGTGENHRSACLYAEKFVNERPEQMFPVPAIPTSALDGVPREERASVLEVKNVKKFFPLTKGALIKRRVGTVKAVNGVSFDIREGECFSIVGESGCGKTTTLLEIMEFSKDIDGEIVIAGVSNKKGLRGSELNALRKNQQMVFQDPTGALDPRFTVYEILAEPLQNQGWAVKDIKKRVLELMKTVGLQPDHVNRFPNQFSGGQRQRIGIARALAVNPKLVALDEPVSALDVSVQAGVINLLEKLRVELGLSYLMVAHDLAVVRHASDRVAVMYLGRVVEIGDVDEVFDNPVHPYTRALLSAIPVPDPEVEANRQRIVLEGDLPTPVNAPDGCAFATRCPIFKLLPEDKQKNCTDNVPALSRASEDHEYTCHYPEHEVAMS